MNYLPINISGAFAFDKDSGFWLILSVPFFPAPQKYNYKYGSSQLIKAQAILCITLDSKYLEEIGNFRKKCLYFINEYAKLLHLDMRR